MLYISITTAVIYLYAMVTDNFFLYDIFCFDKELILRGQVWRLITYVFLDYDANILWMAIGLICYYSLGISIERIWGSCRFTLFYLCGVVMMDVYCMIFDCYASVYYLNLSLFLAFATMFPDVYFRLFFIIPVRAWILAVFDLVLVLSGLLAMPFTPYNLFSVISIANYFLFFGADVKNVFPVSWRANAARLFRKKKQYAPTQKKTGTIPFPGGISYRTDNVKKPHTHQCVICGRTDVSNPELEFRYCSKCNGYHCYCQDHISNHDHVTE